MARDFALPSANASAGQLAGDQICVILRDRELSMPRDATYFYRQC
jgi:hypothetical protein